MSQFKPANNIVRFGVITPEIVKEYSVLTIKLPHTTCTVICLTSSTAFTTVYNWIADLNGGVIPPMTESYLYLEDGLGVGVELSDDSFMLYKGDLAVKMTP